jgi:hypothetical membrane protein
MDAKKFFTGDFSREFLLTRLVPVVLAFFFGGMLISDLLYPGPYDWRYMTISSLFTPGSESDGNPLGSYYLAIGLIVTGVMMVPFAMYLFRKLKVIWRKVALVGAAFMVLGCVGLVLLGSVPDTAALDPIHQGNAGITAVGFIFSFIAFWLIMRNDRQLQHGGKRQFDRWAMVAAYSVMWVAAVGMLLSQFIRFEITDSLAITDLSFIQTGLSVFLSLPLWEWVFFLSIIAYIVLLALMVPANVEALEVALPAE